MMLRAFPRATASPIRCLSHRDSLGSPVAACIRLPISLTAARVLLPIAPVVSTAKGWKKYVQAIASYLFLLAASAQLAAALAETALDAMLDWEYESMQVLSHTRHFPFFVRVQTHAIWPLAIASVESHRLQNRRYSHHRQRPLYNIIKR